MAAVVSRQDLVRQNPFFAPPRPRRWRTVPEGFRPLQEHEKIRRGDLMRVADGWYEEYEGYSLVGCLPGPLSRYYPPTWYRAQAPG